VRNVFKVNPVDGGDAVAIVRFPQTAAGFEPTPLGDAVSFTDRADPAWNIFKVSTTGEAPVQVTKFTEGRVTEHAWTKDGRRLAAVRRMSDGENVWVMNADGSQLRQLTHLSGLDIVQIAWMPDGRRVVVNAGQAGSDAVLIRNFR